MPSGMELFDVSTKSEEGVRMPLVTPAGDETADWLNVIGVDAPVYMRAAARFRQEHAELLATKEKKGIEVGRIEQEVAELHAKLSTVSITAWSFDKPCNKKEVLEFFERAPQVMLQVIDFATNRANFSLVSPKKSEPTRGASSGSESESAKTESQS